MRIVVVSMLSPADLGAIGTILTSLCAECDSGGHSFHIAYEATPVRKIAIPTYISNRQSVVCYRGDGWLGRLRLGLLWRILQFPLTVYLLCRLILREKPDVILALYPRERLLLASCLAAKLCGVSLVPWFLDLYSGYVAGWRKVAARIIEPFVICQSRACAAISEGVSDWYRERYRATWIVLRHPIIPGDFVTGKPVPAVKGHLRIAFSGTIYENCTWNLNLLARTVAERNDFSLTVITPHVTKAHAIIKRHRVDPARATIICAETRADALRELGDADVLFLPLTLDGSLPGEELLTMFPTKAVDYLFTGSTILVHAPQESFLAKHMSIYDGVVMCHAMTPVDLAAELDRAGALAREQQQRAICEGLAGHRSRRQLDQYNARTVVNTLAEVLDI
jgi:hypothetical protein